MRYIQSSIKFESGISKMQVEAELGFINGKEVIGKYGQLAVAFSNNDKLIRITSCPEYRDTLEKTKINFENVILFITLTLPVILIYLGLS